MATLPLHAAGTRIAADLAEAERLSNEYVRCLARLQGSMMNARLDSEMEPYDGQIAVVRVQEAQSQAVQSQGNLFKAHTSMRSDFVRMADVPDVIGRCPTEGSANIAKSA